MRHRVNYLLVSHCATLQGVRRRHGRPGVGELLVPWRVARRKAVAQVGRATARGCLLRWVPTDTQQARLSQYRCCPHVRSGVDAKGVCVCVTVCINETQTRQKKTQLESRDVFQKQV